MEQYSILKTYNGRGISFGFNPRVITIDNKEVKWDTLSQDQKKEFLYNNEIDDDLISLYQKDNIKY